MISGETRASLQVESMPTNSESKCRSQRWRASIFAALAVTTVASWLTVRSTATPDQSPGESPVPSSP